MNKAKPTRLSQETKQYIIARLACFATVAEVVEELALLEPPVRVSHQNVSRYNAATTTGQELSEDLRQLFWQIRERWGKEVESVGIAHQRRRLELLQGFLEKGNGAIPKGLSPKLFLDGLELAEKIVHESYKPRAGVTIRSDGKDDEPGQGGVVIVLPSNGRDRGTSGDDGAGPAERPAD
jgi:hypothetical protein